MHSDDLIDPANKKPLRGFLVPGKSRPFGDSAYPLLMMMATHKPIVDYIREHGGMTIAQMAQVAGWTERRVRGRIQAGLKAADPTYQEAGRLAFPFGHSAMSYRITSFSQTVVRILIGRGKKISFATGELQMVEQSEKGESDAS